MKQIKTTKEAIKEFNKLNIHKKPAIASTNYNNNVIFKCGCCLGVHRVNDPLNIIIGMSFPVKFVMRCENEYITFFRVKGLFKQTVETYWTCNREIGLEALNKMGF